MGYEVEANNYNYKCMIITLIAVEFIWLAAELGIFAVSRSIIRSAAIPVTIIFLAVIILLTIKGMKHKWVKYVIITTEVLGIHIMGTMLTYHVVIFFGVPFLLAAHYQSKKMAMYTLAISLFGMIFVVVLGYYIGLCDLNMVAFTKDRMSSYGELAIIPIYSISWITQLKVMAYFYLPRAILLIVFEIMTLSIAESGRKLQQRNTAIEYDSTHDKMTGVYNKNMYLKMIKTRYPKVKNVGVIYFDVNGLKDINDTLGHDKGDELINMAAKTFSYFETNENKVYRMGGDEFIMIMEDTSEQKMQFLLNSWKKIIAAQNTQITEFKCEIASGYAIGTGENVEKTVELADEAMYKNKVEMKGSAR